VLRAALAQQIAAEITDVIGFNVLITDATGTVVGSGDESRIGQFHEASIDVIRGRRMIAHTADDVRDLVGSLPGVTIPLVIDDDVVGTIGLSGSPEQVERFGLVVKRQTEILMQEAARIGSRLTHQRATEELLRDICDWHRSGFTEAQISRRGKGLGIDLVIPRVVIMVAYERPPNSPPATDTSSGAHTVLSAIQSQFDAPADLSALLARQVIAVTTPVSVSTPATDSRLMDKTRACLDLIRAQGWMVRAGIGSRAIGVRQLNLSSQDAYDALRLGSSLAPQHPIHDIEGFRLHQALSVIPGETRDRLSSAVLGPLLADPDWVELRDTLIAWGEAGFNASRAAKHLHVHRNTITYRFDKIARLLGRRIDEPGLGVTLYLSSALVPRGH
jgi:carbohydrate diacid regulator